MPGRVPAISTDTRIISGRVSVLNAGTRPGTSDQDHFLPKKMKYTVKILKQVEYESARSMNICFG